MHARVSAPLEASFSPACPSRAANAAFPLLCPAVQRHLAWFSIPPEHPSPQSPSGAAGDGQLGVTEYKHHLRGSSALYSGPPDNSLRDGQPPDWLRPSFSCSDSPMESYLPCWYPVILVHFFWQNSSAHYLRSHHLLGSAGAEPERNKSPSYCPANGLRLRAHLEEGPGTPALH